MMKKKESYLMPIISQDFRAARKFVTDLFETQFLMAALIRHGGNVEDAARTSGLSTEEMEDLLAAHQIDRVRLSHK
jgi:hypothetical protein